MDSLSHTLHMMRQHCCMASIDLTDTYYSVTIAFCDQKYLLFQFERVKYKYVRLPNDLSSAPRISTKLLKLVLSTLC